MSTFLFLFGALFSILDPIAVVPIFIALTHNYSKQDRSRVSMLTALNVLIIMLISFFIGHFVLHFLGITINALRITGGILIAQSGFGLLNANPNKSKGISKKVEEDIQTRHEIALTPLAMPLLAGPGCISLLITFRQDHTKIVDVVASCGAMLVMAIIIFLTLKSANYLAKILGASGIVAISRIVGFLSIAIGVQYIISAVLSIVSDL